MFKHLKKLFNKSKPTHVDTDRSNSTLSVSEARRILHAAIVDDVIETSSRYIDIALNDDDDIVYINEDGVSERLYLFGGELQSDGSIEVVLTVNRDETYEPAVFIILTHELLDHYAEYKRAMWQSILDGHTT